jgi:PAS domain S-box-containing protein
MHDMQDALDHERRRNLELFESAAEAAVRVDERDNIIAFNGEAEKLFGYVHGEIVGQPLEILIPERFRAAHARQQAAYVAAPRARALGHDFELYARHQDGHEFPVEISLQPRQDPDGLTITGIIRDTSARMASEREIARQRDVLRLVTDTLPAMMAYVDHDLRVTFANRAYREWFGIGDGDLGVVKLSDVLDRASYRRAEPFIARALKGETAAYERPARHRDGTPATLQATCVPDVARITRPVRRLLRVHQRRDGAAASGETLRKTSRQLAHRVADLEALLDIVPVGVAIADDPACRHIRPNRELSQMLRIGPGVNASSTAPAAQRPTHFTMTRNGVPIPLAELPMQLAARIGQPVLHSQMDIVFDDRSTTSIYGQATPLFDADGNVRGAIGAFLDITDMRRIEDELRQANAVKDEFLGLVSHELKTPITTILGNAEVLQRRGGLLSEQDQAAALADIHDEASRLQGIIDNLLVLARLERSEQIEREPVLLQHIIEHVCDWHTRRNPPPHSAHPLRDGPAAGARGIDIRRAGRGEPAEQRREVQPHADANRHRDRARRCALAGIGERPGRRHSAGRDRPRVHGVLPLAAHRRSRAGVWHRPCGVQAPDRSAGRAHVGGAAHRRRQHGSRRPGGGTGSAGVRGLSAPLANAAADDDGRPAAVHRDSARTARSGAR